MPLSPAASSAEPSSRPPDWSNVPFAVTCARCGHDLHGQTEPKCPVCALEFDWRDACPVEQLTCGKCGYHLYGLRETRCPECGEGFDWRLVLLDYRRRQKDLFEYRWRDQPVRSFFRTCRKALRPRKFWQGIDIHDPPLIRPLLIGPALTIAASVAIATVINAACRTGALLLDSYRFSWRSGATFQYYGGVFLSSLTPSLPSEPSVAGVLTWWLALCGSLLLLRQSMARYRIRNAHIVRIAAYAGALWIGPLIVLGAACQIFDLISDALSLWRPPWSLMVRMWVGLELVVALIPPVPLIFVVYATWSVRCAYHYYLRMPHALGVAVAAQVIAILAALIVLFWMGSQPLWRFLV